MAANSAIEWTNHTANFWWGCFKVSDGCKNCYAETLSSRYGKSIWGPPKATDRELKKGIWNELPRWNQQARESGQRKRVFVQSMADFFEDHPQVEQWRQKAMSMMRVYDWLDFQVLTKRPENILSMVPARWPESWPAHVWAGTSVENQETADYRIKELAAIYQASVRFLSIEPLLAPVTLKPWLTRWPVNPETGAIYKPFNWVIVGGESGKNARPMNPQWVRDIRDECQAAGIPFFFKQWGEWISMKDAGAVRLTAEKGYEKYRVKGGRFDGQSFPANHDFWDCAMIKVGKKAAGAILDGREWREMPVTGEVNQ